LKGAERCSHEIDMRKRYDMLAVLGVSGAERPQHGLPVRSVGSRFHEITI